MIVEVTPGEIYVEAPEGIPRESSAGILEIGILPDISKEKLFCEPC